MTCDLHLRELILEVTNACHHRCLHCSTHGGHPMAGELNRQERLRVLREACDLGLFELRLLGGDPLLRLEEMLELLREANGRVVQKALVYTSAVEEDTGWMKDLVAIKPLDISAEASIYSVDATIHDGITLKRGSLDRLIENSRIARRIGFDLNWNFVWMKPNFGDLEPVLALASQIGIRRVRILRLMLNGRARENQSSLELTIEMASQCGQIFSYLSQKFPSVELAQSKPLAFQLRAASENQTACCSAGGAQLVVQADGVVFPCIGFKDSPPLRVGNVREQSLREILLRSRSMAFQEMSNEFRECPAVLFQKQPNLIQLSL